MKTNKLFAVLILFLVVESICSCNNTNNDKPYDKLNRAMNISDSTNEDLESAALSGWPPQPETNPNISNFGKWLKEVSKLTHPDVSNLVCFIRLMKWKGHPACFLVLSQPDKRNDSILTDNLVLGNLWVWPRLESEISKKDLLKSIQSDFKNFSADCRTNDCIFFASMKVVVGYRNDDYSELRIK